jgi:hypothetical protein
MDVSMILMAEPMQNQRTDEKDTDIEAACAMVRRTWERPMDHLVDSEKMLAATMFSIAARDMDGLGMELRTLVQLKNDARHAYLNFKNQLFKCREALKDARGSIRWINGESRGNASFEVACETADVDVEDAIRRITMALDRKTYYFLSNLKGCECPLCGAKQP